MLQDLTALRRMLAEYALACEPDDFEIWRSDAKKFLAGIFSRLQTAAPEAHPDD